MNRVEEIFEWDEVVTFIQRRFNKDKRPDLNAILMLIGINELGFVRKEYSKEDKQNLMHVAICTLLEPEGYYIYIGKDDDNWPHWELNKKLPALSVKEQEELIKQQIIQYFKK